MGKFETYPETNTLNDDDITLYNRNTLTNKITFATLVSLIRSKLEALGFVSSISAGVGLSGGTITSSGTIKCKLQSEEPSSLQSATISTTTNRQYAVGLDSQGNLSVNVPWVSGNTYQNGNGVLINNNIISIDFDNTHTSTSTVKAATANSVKVTYDDSMRRDGNNANNHVRFNGAFTVGNRSTGSVIGVNSTSEGTNNTVSGEASHAEGTNNIVNGDWSHAEGGYNTISSDYSHAEGSAHVISKNYSHAEGHSNQANGQSSHAEGTGNTTNGQASHAEGTGNTTNSQSSHAEGTGNIVSGKASHVEGYLNRASGDYSHAEGTGTYATGDNSHAEGLNTSASGKASHAEGSDTEAIGDYSHVGGCSVVASLVSQFIQGGYSYKFNSTTNGRGAFGIQPDGLQYTANDTVNSQYGRGGTVLGGVDLKLQLDICAMYLLVCTSYGSQINNSIELISTAKTSSGTPLSTYLSPTSFTTPMANNIIEISDSDDILFHLIRII